MDNLLTDPIFRVEFREGPARLSLPALLAALGEDRLESLPGLQRHQEDAFHIFLCYLAGAALARAGRSEPGQDQAFWRQGLLALADGAENAWKLVVEDPLQPAFMQAPIAAQADFAAFKPKADTPDQLDVLQLAKNHDVKGQRARAVEAETWAYSLASLQTLAGQMGRGNYGIGRMNSGTGSRIRAGVLYGIGIGEQWRRDVKKLLAHRGALLRGPWGYRDDGTVLTWLIPWDLKSPLALSSLDPFFVEIARALRLANVGGKTVALGAGSEGCRIAAKDMKGLLGDPWTPMVDDGKEAKAWTVMSRFSPKDLRDLVFGDERLRMAVMQTPDADRAGAAQTLKVSVLAPGGMGKTNGFHETLIRIPGKATGWLANPGPERERLAKRSKESLEQAGAMQDKVLKRALCNLLEGGPDHAKEDKREVNKWVNQTMTRYAETWADDFFPWLWHSLDQDDDAARLDWLKQLQGMAWGVLQDAMARLPLRSGRGYRSRVRAEGVFYGSLHKQFPQLAPEPRQPPPHEPQGEAP